jgi:hypothetical protein
VRPTGAEATALVLNADAFGKRVNFMKIVNTNLMLRVRIAISARCGTDKIPDNQWQIMT